MVLAALAPSVVGSPVTFRRLRAALPAGAVFTRGGTAYQTEADGSLSIAAIDTPRFRNGVLIERPWTNIANNPEDISAWTENAAPGDATVDANATAAPTGAVTADRINFLAGDPDRGRYEFDGGLPNGNLYTTALYLRRDAAPHDYRLRNPNSAAGVVNGVVAAAGWERVVREDTVVGGVEGLYLRRDAGDGGSLFAWGLARYARDFGILYEYHPVALLAEKLELPNTGIDARQGTLGITWVPNFPAVNVVGGAAEMVIRDVAGTDFRLAWAANDTPSYVRLYNDGVVVAQLRTRHAAGDELRLRVHYGGRPTRPHLEVNGWAVKASAAWVAPVVGAAGTIGSTSVPDLHCPGRYRDEFATRTRHMHRRRWVSLGDSISYEPYGSGNASWNRRAGVLLEAEDGYVLVGGVLNDTLALMGARVAADVVDQDAETCVVLGGVNDLAAGRTLVQMQTDALAIYAALAAAGVRVVACTILPFKGAAAWNAGREAIRVAFNVWVLSRPAGVNLVVDTAAALADPVDAEQLLAAYDSGDFVHPSDAGGVALADAVWAVAA